MASSNDGLIQDMTMMLLYLTSQKGGGGPHVRQAQNAYDPTALELLRQEGLIEMSRAGDSILLTKEACARADFLVSLFAKAQANLIADIQQARQESAQFRDAYRLRVELDLDGLRPCWREILVPGWLTFAGLHEAIQASFLWWGYHLHDFKLRSHGEDLMLIDPAAGGVDAIFAPRDPRRKIIDEATVYLGEVFLRTRTASYSYDYGDGWEHRITLVETLKEHKMEAPVCVAGEGDAPPEDVGSIRGFEYFLEAIGNKSHPDHNNMVAWGHAQFYEPFSLDAVNRRMEAWKTGELFEEWDERNGY